MEHKLTLDKEELRTNDIGSYGCKEVPKKKISSAHYRVNKKIDPYQIDLLERVTDEAERTIVEDCLVRAKDGRGLFEWQKYRDIILKDPYSTSVKRMAAVLLLYIATMGKLRDGEDGDHHHLLPLSAFGSVTDSRNYVHLTVPHHAIAHVALAASFPSIKCLENGLKCMLNYGPGRVHWSKKKLIKWMNGQVRNYISCVQP